MYLMCFCCFWLVIVVLVCRVALKVVNFRLVNFRSVFVFSFVCCLFVFFPIFFGLFVVRFLLVFGYIVISSSSIVISLPNGRSVTFALSIDIAFRMSNPSSRFAPSSW